MLMMYSALAEGVISFNLRVSIMVFLMHFYSVWFYKKFVKFRDYDL